MKQRTARRIFALAMSAVVCLSLAACSPATESEEEPQEEETEEAVPAFVPRVEASEPVESTWFDDAVFIGDSISVTLESYNESYGVLGGADFLCAVSLSQTNARTYSAGAEGLPEYPKGSGQHPKLADAVAQTGASKVYVMLGINCLAGGVDRASSDLVTLLDEVLAASPNVTILVQSVTPMTADSKRADESLNNTVITAYNTRLEEICQERGWYYLDVAQAVADDTGCLQSDLSGDQAMGIHFNYNGASVWADYLLTHVPEALR
jgi:hypothetical protein